MNRLAEPGTGADPPPAASGSFQCIPALTLDGLLLGDQMRGQHRLSEKDGGVFLLKVDAESWDGRILHGARMLLWEQRLKFLIFEYLGGPSHHQTPLPGDRRLGPLIDFLWTAGYGCFLLLDRILLPLSSDWWHDHYDTDHDNYWHYRHSLGDSSAESGSALLNIVCGRRADPDLERLVALFVRDAVPRRWAVAAARGWRAGRPPAAAAPPVRGPGLRELRRWSRWRSFLAGAARRQEGTATAALGMTYAAEAGGAWWSPQPNATAASRLLMQAIRTEASKGTLSDAVVPEVIFQALFALEDLDTGDASRRDEMYGIVREARGHFNDVWVRTALDAALGGL